MFISYGEYWESSSIDHEIVNLDNVISIELKKPNKESVLSSHKNWRICFHTNTNPIIWSLENMEGLQAKKVYRSLLSNISVMNGLTLKPV